jgi:hypothetical protein
VLGYIFRDKRHNAGHAKHEVVRKAELSLSNKGDFALGHEARFGLASCLARMLTSYQTIVTSAPLCIANPRYQKRLGKSKLPRNPGRQTQYQGQEMHLIQ